MKVSYSYATLDDPPSTIPILMPVISVLPSLILDPHPFIFALSTFAASQLSTLSQGRVYKFLMMA